MICAKNNSSEEALKKLNVLFRDLIPGARYLVHGEVHSGLFAESPSGKAQSHYRYQANVTDRPMGTVKKKAGNLRCTILHGVSKFKAQNMELNLNNSKRNVTPLKMFAGRLAVGRNLSWLHRAYTVDRVTEEKHNCITFKASLSPDTCDLRILLSLPHRAGDKTLGDHLWCQKEFLAFYCFSVHYKDEHLLFLFYEL